MSTTDSEDPETEIQVLHSPHVEPAQNYGESPTPPPLLLQEKERGEQEDNEIAVEEDCIFPFIDLETAGNADEDWEIFNVLCGVVSTRRWRGKVSLPSMLFLILSSLNFVHFKRQQIIIKNLSNRCQNGFNIFAIHFRLKLLFLFLIYVNSPVTITNRRLFTYPLAILNIFTLDSFTLFSPD